MPLPQQQWRARHTAARTSRAPAKLALPAAHLAVPSRPPGLVKTVLLRVSSTLERCQSQKYWPAKTIRTAVSMRRTHQRRSRLRGFSSLWAVTRQCIKLASPMHARESHHLPPPLSLRRPQILTPSSSSSSRPHAHKPLHDNHSLTSPSPQPRISGIRAPNRARPATLDVHDRWGVE